VVEDLEERRYFAYNSIDIFEKLPNTNSSLSADTAFEEKEKGTADKNTTG